MRGGDGVGKGGFKKSKPIPISFRGARLKSRPTTFGGQEKLVHNGAERGGTKLLSLV